jgi:hypothetical protein
MAETLHFKNHAAYKRWLAYGQMHHKFKHHNARIYINGKFHHVHHSRGQHRSRARAASRHRQSWTM